MKAPGMITARVLRASLLNEITLLTPLQRIMASSLKTKEAVRAKLAEFNEVPPMSWDKTQLMARLMELQGQTMTDADQKKKEMIRGLNKASRKKADLQAFVRENLETKISGYETIPQLQAMGMKAILLSVPSQSSDEMGFGMHANKTYLQVATEFPQYLEWCQKTFEEEPVNWRMKRFILWAVDWNKKNAGGLKFISKGYMSSSVKDPVKAKGKGKSSTEAAMSSGADSSFTMVPAVPVPDSEEEEMITEVDLEVEALENQIRELRRQQALATKNKVIKKEQEPSTWAARRKLRTLISFHQAFVFSAPSLLNSFIKSFAGFCLGNGMSWFKIIGWCF